MVAHLVFGLRRGCPNHYLCKRLAVIPPVPFISLNSLHSSAFLSALEIHFYCFVYVNGVTERKYMTFPGYLRSGSHPAGDNQRCFHSPDNLQVRDVPCAPSVISSNTRSSLWLSPSPSLALVAVSFRAPASTHAPIIGSCLVAVAPWYPIVCKAYPAFPCKFIFPTRLA